MLCVGRLLGLFGCSLHVHTMEHRANGSTVVPLVYKVLAEYRCLFAKESEKAKDQLAIGHLCGKKYPHPLILTYRNAPLSLSVEKCITCNEPVDAIVR